MPSMTQMLEKLRDVPPSRATAFTERWEDESFDGVATAAEMAQFCDAAKAAIEFDAGRSGKCRPALDALKAFALDGSPIRFRYLRKNVIIFQLVLRVLKPQRINQIKYGLCGPAHFAVLLARSTPAEYVALAIQFARDGAANHRGLRITVIPEILEYRIPSQFIPEADWVVAASLRNSAENFPQSKYVVETIGDTEHHFVLATGKEGEYAGTSAKLVCEWLVKAGFSEVAAVTNMWRPENAVEYMAQAFADTNFQFFQPQIPRLLEDQAHHLLDPMVNLHAAQTLLKAGWLVLMKVNSAWSGATASTPAELDNLEQSLSAPHKTAVAGQLRLPKDNHWIFVKKIELGDGDARMLGKVQMTIYTYGAKVKVPPVSQLVFLQNYGGFVAAKG